MNTITVWLLIGFASPGGTGAAGGSAAQVLERFATLEDCQQVHRSVVARFRELRDSRHEGLNEYDSKRFMCAKATVVKP
jgi:hypothetical protein